MKKRAATHKTARKARKLKSLDEFYLKRPGAGRHYIDEFVVDVK